VGYLGILLDAAPIESEGYAPIESEVYAPIEREVYAPIEKEGRLRATLSENRQTSLLQAVCRLNVVRGKESRAYVQYIGLYSILAIATGGQGACSCHSQGVCSSHLVLS